MRLQAIWYVTVGALAIAFGAGAALVLSLLAGPVLIEDFPENVFVNLLPQAGDLCMWIVGHGGCVL